MFVTVRGTGIFAIVVARLLRACFRGFNARREEALA